MEKKRTECIIPFLTPRQSQVSPSSPTRYVLGSDHISTYVHVHSVYNTYEIHNVWEDEPRRLIIIIIKIDLVENKISEAKTLDAFVVTHRCGNA